MSYRLWQTFRHNKPDASCRIRIFTGLAVCLVILAILSFVYAFNPQQSSLFPPCPSKTLTGLNCPGCGSTRALHHLLHGRVLDALGKNPLMVISIPFLILLFVRPDFARKRWVPWCALSILIVYGIIRNIPYYPFTYLAP
jgi:hypothetical protein